MSAYHRAELSVEAYLVRILAAMCRQSGGELRVKGELIDMIGEGTVLEKSWDSQRQELVLKASMGMFTEVFRVIPEKQTPRSQPQVVDPIARTPVEQSRPVNGQTEEFLPHRSPLDDESILELEHKRDVARAAATIRNELLRRKKEREAAKERTI